MLCHNTRSIRVAKYAARVEMPQELKRRLHNVARWRIIEPTRIKLPLNFLDSNKKPSQLGLIWSRVTQEEVAKEGDTVRGAVFEGTHHSISRSLHRRTLIVRDQPYDLIINHKPSSLLTIRERPRSHFVTSKYGYGYAVLAINPPVCLEPLLFLLLRSCRPPTIPQSL